jgi:Uma2 family endonuclease
MAAQFFASTEDQLLQNQLLPDQLLPDQLLQRRPKPWPTMYDLPSEDPKEPGLPNEFHDLQLQLLSATLRLEHCSAAEMFSISDMNLYYDRQNTGWYKRPDWMLVLGVSRLYENRDLRQSYVIWDEQVVPALIMEFLSEGTEAEDLGRFAPKPIPSKAGKPPGKFTVYERILKIPNYIVYDHKTEEIRYFRLINGIYQLQPVAVSNPKVWIPDFDLGLGIWDGSFQNAPPEQMRWLRWCDAAGNWVLTEAEQERAAKEELQQQLQQSIQNFRNLGLSVAQIAQALNMTESEMEEWCDRAG